MASEEIDLRFARYVLYDTIDSKMIVVSDDLTIVAQAALLKEREAVDDKITSLRGLQKGATDGN